MSSANARVYGPMGETHEQPARVASMFVNQAEAQISAMPEGDGFLIRVWPPNGTHEFGGSNVPCLTACVRFTDDGAAVLDGLDWRPGTAQPTPTPTPKPDRG